MNIVKVIERNIESSKTILHLETCREWIETSVEDVGDKVSLLHKCDSAECRILKDANAWYNSKKDTNHLYVGDA